MRKKLLLTLLLCCSAIGRAEAETTLVDGAALTVRAVSGYCNSFDSAVLAVAARAAVRAKPFAVSAPCSDLAAFIDGRGSLTRYVVWAVEATDSGAAFRLPLSMTRTQYADGLAKTIPTLDISRLPPDVLKKLNSEGIKAEMKSPGLIDREPDAVYIASLVTYTSGGMSKVMAAVASISAIHHFSLTVNAYDEFRDGSTFSGLLGVVKPLTRAALQDNPD